MDLFKVGFGLWVLGVIVTIAFWVGVIWVAWHFISKFW